MGLHSHQESQRLSYKRVSDGREGSGPMKGRGKGKASERGPAHKPQFFTSRLRSADLIQAEETRF